MRGIKRLSCLAQTMYKTFNGAKDYIKPLWFQHAHPQNQCSETVDRVTDWVAHLQDFIDITSQVFLPFFYLFPNFLLSYVSLWRYFSPLFCFTCVLFMISH